MPSYARDLHTRLAIALTNGSFRYADLAAAEETTWSVDPVLRFGSGATFVLSDGSTRGFGSPSDAGGGIIRSSAGVTDGGS